MSSRIQIELADRFGRSGEFRPAWTNRSWIIVGVLALVLAACSNGSDTTDGSSSTTGSPIADLGFTAPPAPELDPESVAEGERLYAQNCSSCHMPDRSGQSDWKIPNDDGTYPPPPHDNSGHTWHHPDELLEGIIRDGLDVGVLSGMPTFGGVLSNDEISMIIDFLKSEWGEQERAFQWQVTWQGEQ